MTWKGLGRTVAALLAACTLAAASPAAAQPARAGRQSGFLEQLTAALRQRIAALWGQPGTKSCQSCMEAGPGLAPQGSSGTNATDPPCDGCTEQGPGIDPHG